MVKFTVDEKDLEWALSYVAKVLKDWTAFCADHKQFELALKLIAYYFKDKENKTPQGKGE